MQPVNPVTSHVSFLSHEYFKTQIFRELLDLRRELLDWPFSPYFHYNFAMFASNGTKYDASETA